MSSNDGSDRRDPQPNSEVPRRRLEIKGDVKNLAHADRVSTVAVYDPDIGSDPTPPPTQPAPHTPQHQHFQSGPQQPIQPQPPEVLGADDPTPPPGSLTIPHTQSNPAVQRPDHYPQQHHGHGTGPQQHYQGQGTGPQQHYQGHGTGPIQSVPGTGPHPSLINAGSASHGSNHISNSGFIPTENFQPAIDAARKRREKQSGASTPRTKKISIGKVTIDIPDLTWLDDADRTMRLQYAGGGFLAGALLGTFLGILNTFLQGWDVADGVGQIFVLIFFFGLIAAAFAAMRPARVDKLLSRIKFFQESTVEEDTLESDKTGEFPR